MRAIWTMALAAAVAGCGTFGMGMGGSDDDYRRTTVYEDAGYDETWSAILQTFAELELPISTLEKESGLVATDWILVEDPEDAMDCDHGHRNAEMRFNVFLKTVAGGQEMTITSSARARGEEADSLQRCESTGEQEQSIQTRVGRKVG
ncbi:MAG TPA: hypothetical protein VM778_08595 [Gemmatimonadota bacterium]|nr:hypothetical protein [Gemmatimonadota bacterium]